MNATLTLERIINSLVTQNAGVVFYNLQTNVTRKYQGFVQIKPLYCQSVFTGPTKDQHQFIRPQNLLSPMFVFLIFTSVTLDNISCYCSVN